MRRAARGAGSSAGTCRDDLDTGEVFGALLEVDTCARRRAVLDPDRGQRVVCGARLIAAPIWFGGTPSTRRERADLAQPHAAPLRQVRRTRSATARPGDVRDEHVAVAVEDRPARRLHADRRGRWLFCAARGSCSPFSTWSDQSRRKRIAKAASASTPRNADAQRELRGQPVRLGGARVGRQEAARDRLRLAKEPHLPRDPLTRPQQPACERVHRHGQQQIQETPSAAAPRR